MIVKALEKYKEVWKLKDSGKIKGLDFQECVLKLLKVNSK
jgi:hypothetical protein